MVQLSKAHKISNKTIAVNVIHSAIDTLAVLFLYWLCYLVRSNYFIAVDFPLMLIVYGLMRGFIKAK